MRGLPPKRRFVPPQILAGLAAAGALTGMTHSDRMEFINKHLRAAQHRDSPPCPRCRTCRTWKPERKEGDTRGPWRCRDCGTWFATEAKVEENDQPKDERKEGDTDEPGAGNT